jgi:hypothetical protein
LLFFLIYYYSKQSFIIDLIYEAFLMAIFSIHLQQVVASNFPEFAGIIYTIPTVTKEMNIQIFRRLQEAVRKKRL